MSKWQKFFAAMIQTEMQLVPIFVHNPNSQKIAGAVLVSEDIFAQIFGLAPQMGPASVPNPPAV